MPENSSSPSHMCPSEALKGAEKKGMQRQDITGSGCWAPVETGLSVDGWWVVSVSC